MLNGDKQKYPVHVICRAICVRSYEACQYAVLDSYLLRIEKVIGRTKRGSKVPRLVFTLGVKKRNNYTRKSKIVLFLFKVNSTYLNTFVVSFRKTWKELAKVSKGRAFSPGTSLPHHKQDGTCSILRKVKVVGSGILRVVVMTSSIFWDAFFMMILVWLIFQSWKWSGRVPPIRLVTFNGLLSVIFQKMEAFKVKVVQNVGR
jgi:hypothetical protein